MNQHLRNFFFILGAALASSVMGAVFAVIVTLVSPEFVSGLLFHGSGSLTRYAAAVGMIWGLFLGAGSMAFCLGVAAISNWFRPKDKTEKDTS